MKEFKLIHSLPASAEYNMALDKVIFERYLEDGGPVFRIYRFSQPSFTYGVSQDPSSELDLERCALEGIGVVKRMTGGGVLFHSDEITYSFVCSKFDVGEPEGVFVSYREICAFLLRFYQSLGLKADFAFCSQGFKEISVTHPLCSASHEKFDLVINGRKIGGNAQKRKRQVVFQHGSIPFSIDWGLMARYVKFMPSDISKHCTALNQELSAFPDKDLLERKLINAFAEIFSVNFKEDKELVYEASLA
ncbi:MAG: lipoate--protein ligase family protein [Candidatus Omnitrophica bacterium]|nr:lipoate--protein ligase family protein [Candidatus Omnitrophota bacterium]